jgi:hypothetical protein
VPPVSVIDIEPMPSIDDESSPMPPTSTTVDHVHADSVPIDTSVSMVVAPWRRFIHADRWNPQPHQNTIGVASAATTHSQRSNCSDGTIDNSTTGTPRINATVQRRRRSASRRRSAPSWSASTGAT